MSNKFLRGDDLPRFEPVRVIGCKRLPDIDLPIDSLIGIEFEKYVKKLVMLNQSDLRFLREKIQELRNAIFISQNTSLLRMATSIVSISSR